MSLVGPTITCAPGVFMYLVSLKTQHHTGTTGQECIGISNLDWSPVLAPSGNANSKQSRCYKFDTRTTI